MLEVAQGPLGKGWCVNPNRYSCYFIIAAMSYVVKNTGCWNGAESTEGIHSPWKVVFQRCNHPRELLAEIFSCKFSTFTGVQALLKKKKKTNPWKCVLLNIWLLIVSYWGILVCMGVGKGLKRKESILKALWRTCRFFFVPRPPYKPLFMLLMKLAIWVEIASEVIFVECQHIYWLLAYLLDQGWCFGDYRIYV